MTLDVGVGSCLQFLLFIDGVSVAFRHSGFETSSNPSTYIYNPLYHQVTNAGAREAQ